MAAESRYTQTISLLSKYWVIISFVFGAVVYGVRADASIKTLVAKDVIYDKLVGDRTDRLARLETKVDTLTKGQDDMASKLDILISRRQK